jgi:predicted DNA-binding protein (UPF0251 family)
MLQTLVKKDPWYLQVIRGFSGRILQSTAVAAAAVVIAMVVVRPTFQSVRHIDVAHAHTFEPVRVPLEVATVELTLAEASSLPNYDTDVISVDSASSDVHFVRDFGMESIQVAAYDASAYSSDSPHARTSFASAGVASLVY